MSISGNISSLSKRFKKNSPRSDANSHSDHRRRLSANDSRRIAPSNMSFRRRPSSNAEPEHIVPASKASAIRIISGQIFQKLYDASDKLDDEMLQQLSAEIAKHSQDAIKSKLFGKETSSKKAGGIMRGISTGSLQQAINLRMANVVEKDDIPQHSIHEARFNNGSTMSSKNAFDLLTKLPDDDGQYDAFLNICDPELMTNQKQLRNDYIAFKRSDSNVPFLLFTFLCGVLLVGTGFAWFRNMSMYHDYPTATLSIIFAILSAVSLLWVVLNRIAFLSFRYNIGCLQWYHDHVANLYESPYGQWPDNGAIVCAALSTGFYLVNIVLMGWCDPDMVVNVGSHKGHGCITFVEPPPEAFVFTMFIVLLLQVAARGVSRIALLCSWMICFAAINVSIYLSDSGNYIWINVLQLLILCVSYELERQPLRQFIKTIRAVEAGEMAAKLKVRLAAFETLQASEALKAKCSLVRHIGHEIRTPLNVVGVGVDMLHKELAKQGALVPDEVREIVSEIQEASSASLEVVNELLMFEKLAAGMTSLECVPTLILSFLEQAMKQHLLPARAKNIVFELVPSTVTRNVAINVDPIKLVTVFRNLFSNAIKFTKKQGRVTVRAEVKCQKPGGEDVLEVTVQDTGAGLSPANLSKLFGEGVQFNANGLQGGGGSGLGLFITKGIVELHKNGKIWAESEGEGFGCTFFVQLPLHSIHYVATPHDGDSVGASTPGYESPSALGNREALVAALTSISSKQQEPLPPGEKTSEAHEETRPAVSPQPAAPVTPTASVVPAWKPTILVVDDSSMNRKMLVRMLTSKGFACREAEDGVEGLSEMSQMFVRKSRHAQQHHGDINISSSNDGADPLGSRAGSPAMGSTKNALPRSSVIRLGSRGDEYEQKQLLYAIDAVLIDSNMPRMNGPEAIVEMRKMGFHGPIIGVSGGDEKTMKEFLDAGADNVMQKPAQSDKLVNMLLTGLQLVVQEASSRDLLQGGKDGNARSSQKGRVDHIKRLKKFIEETDAKINK